MCCPSSILLTCVSHFTINMIWDHLNLSLSSIYLNIPMTNFCVKRDVRKYISLELRAVSQTRTFLQLVFLHFVFDTCVLKCIRSPRYPSLYLTSYQGGLIYFDNRIFQRDYASTKCKERFLFNWYGQEEQVRSLNLGHEINV